MNDKQIRSILIEYLKASAKELRIYQEKSIGASVCDVMAVTDKLTGYEIKSDSDNYQRIERQVAAYDRFFDENYLVVSKQHIKSAAYRVPESWGILCIFEDSITVERKAKKNGGVSRRAQLSVLWKLELKNLLIKNRLPLYPLKTKDFISGVIAERVEGAELGRQIAEELMRRDYSIYGAEDFTIRMEKAEEFPQTEIIDALSERDLDEFSLDKWIELYRMAKKVREVKEEAQRAIPAARQPHAIPYSDIEVSLGAPYIDVQIIKDFISEVFKCSRHITVIHEQITGNWSLPNKRIDEGCLSAQIKNKYGIPRYSAFFILEATLNLREIRIVDGRTNAFCEEETIAALEKQKLIKQAFREWIWLDEDRRWQVEEAYNELFARYGHKPRSGAALEFPQMSEDVDLFPYQTDAVQRIIDEPNTLLAFDVGAGKTYIMIAAAMKLRQEGLSRKNMFVVPNNIVGQWEAMFVKLYPSAKVLSIEPKSFKPEIRRKVLEQIRDGNYDGIIIAYSCFEQIELSSTAVMANLDRMLANVKAGLERERTSGMWYSPEYRQLQKEEDRIKKTLSDYIAQMRLISPTGVSFEELEITGLFLDEAHNYKNLPINTRLRQLSGINTKGSLKCMDMFQKIRCVQATGRGAVFATGTPLCNSISDVYTMQMYLQHEDMERTHLNVFDNWVKTFAEPEQLFEIDVSASNYRMVRKFAKFFNLPELSRMFSQIAVFYAMEDAEDLPEREAVSDIVIEKYVELSSYMHKLVERTERIRKKNVHPSKDNMLKVSTDGRKAALDLRLVGLEQPGGRNSKADTCVETAVDIYRQYPTSTQLIFCDYSTPKCEKFSVYAELKKKLCAAGVKAKEIAFIHSYGTELRKLELSRKFNAGEVRFIIGSTFKLGIGANVQQKLKAIHHLDVPWRPADMVQREGRIIRRGNENESVFIYRYIAKGSFDAYSWQILERKQRFISQFLSGSAYQRSASDLEDNVLTYAEVKALALADPIMKKLAEKENELRNMRVLNSHEITMRSGMDDEISELEKQIPLLLRCAEGSRNNADHAASLDGDRIKSELEAICNSVEWKQLSESHSVEKPIPLLGFSVSAPREQNGKKPYAVIERNGVEYELELGSSTTGNARRFTNFLKKLDRIAQSVAEKHANALKRKADLINLRDERNTELTERIRACENEIARLQMQLRSQGQT